MGGSSRSRRYKPLVKHVTKAQQTERRTLSTKEHIDRMAKVVELAAVHLASEIGKLVRLRVDVSDRLELYANERQLAPVLMSEEALRDPMARTSAESSRLSRIEARSFTCAKVSAEAKREDGLRSLKISGLTTAAAVE